LFANDIKKECFAQAKELGGCLLESMRATGGNFMADETEHGYLEDGIEEEGGSLMTALLTGAAVAVIKPELLPGMAIGVAAAMGPKLLPTIGGVLRPFIRTAVRAGYSTAIATRGVVAEAGEQVQDMFAEARAEVANGRKPARRRNGARKPAKRRRPAKVAAA
jgi:hypothetical protein